MILEQNKTTTATTKIPPYTVITYNIRGFDMDAKILTSNRIS
jgi:hypothetical protein